MKKTEQATLTRARIIRAAGECFAEKGYSACSMRDIAEHAGISKGALYGHFSGKEELFQTIIVMEHERGAERARRAAEHGPYIEAILAFMRECIQNSGFPVDHRLWVEALAVASRDAEMRQSFMSGERTARDFFKTLIRKGIEAGEIDEALDLEGMSILMFALGDGIISRIADDPEFDFHKHFGVFETVIRRALERRGQEKL